MIVKTRGGGQTGDSLGDLGILAVTEPDGGTAGVGLCDGGMDHMLPPAQVYELAGQLIH